jgi:methyl-accepting chemotaxis protein
MNTNKKTLSIRARLIAGFGVVLIALVALTVIAISRVEMVRARLDDIIDVNGVKERYAINFRGSVHDRSIAVRDVTLVSAAELPSVIDHIHTLASQYEESAGPLAQIYAERTDITAEERAIDARVNTAREQSLPLLQQVISLQQAGDVEGARNSTGRKAPRRARSDLCRTYRHHS